MRSGRSEPFQFFLNHPLPMSDESLKIGDGLTLASIGNQDTMAACLDDFGNSLKRSGRILIRYQKNLLLLKVGEPEVWTQVSAPGWRFIPQMDEGPVKSRLQDCSPIRAFQAGAENAMGIKKYVVLDDNRKTTARCTLYHLDNGERSLTFGFTQPLRGYDAEHSILRRFLEKNGASALDSHANLHAQCGFDQPMYDSKPSVEITADAPAIETANHLVATSLNVARQNEQGVSRDYDTEFLHDYRVNLRKVRSVLSLFKGVYGDEDTAHLKRQFSDIMKVTNRLRDLDVYLLAKQDLFGLLPERMQPGLEQMFSIFNKERRRELKHVIKMLHSSSYQRDMAELQEKFRSTDRLAPGPKAMTASLPFATHLIWARYSKVCRIARKIDQSTPDEEIHELRIQCKKLRYLMEFFAGLFPQRMLKDLIKPLKRLQDNLGNFNDFSVQQDSLQAFLNSYANSHRSGNVVAMAESIGALIILLRQKQAEQRAQVTQSFADFDSPEIRQQFTDVFHHGTSQ